MRIQLISDLHLESQDVSLPKVKADLTVLAGDTDLGSEGVRWAAAQFPHRPVVLVAGNHEFDNSIFQDTLNQMREAASGTNVQVLENNIFSMNNFVIAGCTLWTDFDYLAGEKGEAARALAKQELPEFWEPSSIVKWRSEYSGLQNFSLERSVQIHQESVDWLSRAPSQCKGKQLIVVSHHSPVANSLPDDLRNGMLAPSFASNLKPLIEKLRPAAWFYGHVHSPSAEQIGVTKVINNSCGRLDEEGATRFNPELVLEFPD